MIKRRRWAAKRHRQKTLDEGKFGLAVWRKSGEEGRG